jgi:NAD+ synthase
MSGLERVSQLIVKGIRGYVRESGHKGVVIGISGGIDSAVCVALATKALGKKNVLGLIMPNGRIVPEETADAVMVCRKVNIRHAIVNVGEATSALEMLLLKASMGKKCGRVDAGNLASRTRMIMLYGAAACRGYLVLGTSNKSELLLGYFTKHGDGGADILPIGDLYKREVRGLARHLRIPEKIIKKTPTAGLWTGQTDEGEMGFSYELADRILYMFLEQGMDGEDIIGQIGEEKTVKKIYRMVKGSSHKRSAPRIFSVKMGRWR